MIIKNLEEAQKAVEIYKAIEEGRTITFNGNQIDEDTPFENSVLLYDILEEKDVRESDPCKVKLPAICKDPYQTMYKKGFRFQTVHTNEEAIKVYMTRGLDKAVILCMNISSDEFGIAQSLNITIPAVAFVAEASLFSISDLNADTDIIGYGKDNEIIEFHVTEVNNHSVTGFFNHEEKEITTSDIGLLMHLRSRGLIDEIYVRKSLDF